MEDTLNQADVRSGLLSEFTKGKGLASFDDEEEEPLRELEDHHQLSIHVEHCDCVRPSHHLRGSRAKYTQYFKDVSVYMQKFEGAGEVAVMANQPEWSGLPTAQPAMQAAGMLAESMQEKPKRPASAAPGGQRTPLQPMALPGGLGDQYGFLTPPQGRWPRVGSFEVNYTLLNVKSKANYGPYLLSSKLVTERWPNEAKLQSHLQEHLQLLLKQDEQHYALEKMVRNKIDEKKALASEKEDDLAEATDLRTVAEATAAPPEAVQHVPPTAPPAAAATPTVSQAEQAPAPAEGAPAADAPAPAPTPATDAPAEEAPASEAPAEEAPALEAPALEAPAEEAPAPDAPAPDAPAEEAPAPDAPAPAPADAPVAAAEAPTPESAPGAAPVPAPGPAMPPANLDRGDSFFAKGGRAA